MTVDPVGAGRCLVAASWIAVAGFAPLLGPDQHTWSALAVTGLILLVMLAVSFRLPWPLMPPSATVVFPVYVCAILSAVGAVSPGLTAPLTGLLTLCHAYLGLTQPPGTSLFAVPISTATVLLTYGGASAAVIVRIIISVLVWTVLAELLARLTRQQAALADLLAGKAHRDDLTGIANRRDLDVRMTLTAPGDTLVMCDLDHFKHVNDAHGHAHGDRVLADFGAILRVMVRGDDYCARYGGEEFVLILRATSRTQARSLLTRLQEQWATLQPGMTFSAGIATCTPERRATETLAVADAMLYAAKSDGRDRIVSETDSSEGARVAS